MTSWAFIPARGGSKSILLKNMVELEGKPLIEYGIRAGQASNRFQRIVCSTDEDSIRGTCESLGVEVDARPESLCGDEVAVADVAREFLERQDEPPDVLVLIQPTSPFLLAIHVSALLDAFQEKPAAQSAHTVVPCAHNNHAWNQRTVDDEGEVGFLYAKERSQAYNKQLKPKLFIFGNLIAARSSALLSGTGFYAAPSIGVPISPPYEFDLDGPTDIPIARAILRSGAVDLPHMKQAGGGSDPN